MTNQGIKQNRGREEHAREESAWQTRILRALCSGSAISGDGPLEGCGCIHNEATVTWEPSLTQIGLVNARGVMWISSVSPIERFGDAS